MGFKGRKPRDRRRFATYTNGVVWGLGASAECAMRDGIANGGEGYDLETAPVTWELWNVVMQMRSVYVSTRLRADGVLELA